MISIIVPVYNVEKYLNKCVDSIINQTYKDIEIILVDDGSTDSSGKICDSYIKIDHRIKVFHKENGGLSSARNFGIEKSSGEYIGFVDSDDYISKNMYEDLYNTLNNEENSVSCCFYKWLNEEGKEFNPYLPLKDRRNNIYLSAMIEETSESFLQNLFLFNRFVYTVLFLYPRKIFDNVKFINGITNEDFIFISQIMNYIRKVKYSKNQNYNYILRNGSIVNSKDKNYKFLNDCIKNKFFIYNWYQDKNVKLLDYIDAHIYWMHAEYLISVNPKIKENDNEYKNIYKFIRKKIVYCCKLQYLTNKEKIILLFLCFFPSGLYNIRKIKAILKDNK